MVRLTLLSCFAAVATTWLTTSAEEAKDEGNKVYLSSHSLHMPYIDEEMRSNYFEFGGDTVINTYKGIRLTPDIPSRAGWLWSKHALPTNSWEIEFEFKISGAGTNLFGDGFAFWATTNDPAPGPVFGSVNEFEGLGIFFDTYANSKASHNFPYVMAMIGDGKTSYENDKDGSNTEAAGCEAEIRDRSFPTKALVTYFRDEFLEVKLQWEAENKWTPCFTVDKVRLPSLVFLGFSAHTGEISDSHEIISITSHSVKKQRKTSQPMYTAKPAQRKQESSGWLWKLLALGGVGGVIYYLYKNNNQNSKRF
ncbi:hypothetical protein K493DRAFT_341674 [Basidiobolus meristosporus CBS 931.73]|uniref:L-type lectin-like domain-containing protein n=1 Tax=Basidiobolus meristosporus CBS 931.73 TaxID=1314790 RepID=A0A1Y1XKC1_9FUNG|nr:hypothetical protein K493DRAFT_341674 [Basidiobolus meristosporus CBS 931.73]|eukprot:ORX86162.1 hypothetical protein K493DRAFT_341674 [Basidiobolus meristosporus CBS 931.73]